MCNPVFKTFNPQKKASNFEFYILCKGLNSGKPLTTPCPNSFVCVCENQSQKDFYFWLFFGLWKAKYFHQFLVGSCIPFLRLDDAKNEASKNALIVGKNLSAYQSTVSKVKLIEEKEQQIRQNLKTLSELKRALIHTHLRAS